MNEAPKDGELERAAQQLASFRTDSALPEILDRYGALIESYRRLQSVYEEERDARERYKQIARGLERNPFVLVLVDGDGYVFNEREPSEPRHRGLSQCGAATSRIHQDQSSDQGP